MTAKNRIKEIAGGNFHSLTYELTEYSDGQMKASCRVYIYGYGSHEALSWNEVILFFEQKIRKSKPSYAEMPLEDRKDGDFNEHKI